MLDHSISLPAYLTLLKLQKDSGKEGEITDLQALLAPLEEEWLTLSEQV